MQDHIFRHREYRFERVLSMQLELYPMNMIETNVSTIIILLGVASVHWFDQSLRHSSMHSQCILIPKDNKSWNVSNSYEIIEGALRKYNLYSGTYPDLHNNSAWRLIDKISCFRIVFENVRDAIGEVPRYIM